MSDTADSTAVDITKLKVADLRKELKARGLSTVGNKNELMERLQSALTGDSIDESVLVDSVLMDDDDVLNDVELDDEHDKSMDLYSNATEDALITAPVTTSVQPILKRPHIEISSRTTESLEENTVSKKIVLDRNSTTVPVSGPETKVTEDGLSSDDKEQGEEKKIIKLGSLSEKERLEMRARKFGIPLTADLKKEVRAQRFGLNNTKSITNNKVDTSLETLKKRAERFGSSVSKKLSEAEAKEKLEKRKERFCTVQNANVSTSSSAKIKIKSGLTNDEKAKLRLERFKTEVK